MHALISRVTPVPYFQVLDEVCVCGLVFNDRNTGETTVSHLLVNWPNPTTRFYSHKTSKPIAPVQQRTFSSQRLLWGDPVSAGGSARNVTGGGGGEEQGRSKDADGASQSEKKEEEEEEVVVEGEGEETATQFGALWNAPPPFNVSWSTMSCQSQAGPAHNGRRTYVYRLSPSGDVAALAVNSRKAMNIRVMFFSPLTPGELSSTVYPLAKEGRESGRQVAQRE